MALLAAIHPRFSVATFTGVLVILAPGITHVGPLESAFDRVLDVAVGAITALTVPLVTPARAYALAIEAAAQMLDLLARALPELFAGFMQTGHATPIGRIQEVAPDGQASVSSAMWSFKKSRVGAIYAPC